ncbi:MAG: 4-(cytidine 5'-diphospho)-2-C-methyl-D-erythritol kinase [Candidatus Dormibacteria bacterium]
MLRSGRAPAKLNLGLELLGRRADGYHQLAAISQTIDWSDVVAVEQGDPGREPPHLQVWGPEAHRVPLGESNLALRAAILLRGETVVTPVTRVGLEKRIPTQSGLGGGSADAAAVLRLAAVALASERRQELALTCGADVPFGLRGGAGQVGGVGEVVSPLPTLRQGAFVIVVLDSVDTTAAYAASQPQDFSDGRRVAALAAAMQIGAPLDPELLGSSLQAAALRAVPPLGARLARLAEATPGSSWAMTGSGGAFFSYLPDPGRASALATLVGAACPKAPVRVALPLGPMQ